jgi:hypothetical protein
VEAAAVEAAPVEAAPVEGVPAEALRRPKAQRGRSRGIVAGRRASTATTVAAANTDEGDRTSDSETTVTENSAAHRYMSSTLCR